MDFRGIFERLDEYFGKETVRVLISVVIIFGFIWGANEVYQNTVESINITQNNTGDEIEQTPPTVNTVVLPEPIEKTDYFIGDVLEITGVIDKIIKESFGGYFLAVQGKKIRVNTMCPDEEFIGFSKLLAKGSKITLRGKVSAFLDVTISIEDCEVLEYFPSK